MTSAVNNAEKYWLDFIRQPDLAIFFKITALSRNQGYYH